MGQSTNFRILISPTFYLRTVFELTFSSRDEIETKKNNIIMKFPLHPLPLPLPIQPRDRWQPLAALQLISFFLSLFSWTFPCAPREAFIQRRGKLSIYIWRGGGGSRPQARTRHAARSDPADAVPDHEAAARDKRKGPCRRKMATAAILPRHATPRRVRPNERRNRSTRLLTRRGRTARRRGDDAHPTCSPRAEPHRALLSIPSSVGFIFHNRGNSFFAQFLLFRGVLSRCPNRV